MATPIKHDELDDNSKHRLLEQLQIRKLLPVLREFDADFSIISTRCRNGVFIGAESSLGMSKCKFVGAWLREYGEMSYKPPICTMMHETLPVTKLRLFRYIDIAPNGVYFCVMSPNV